MAVQFVRPIHSMCATLSFMLTFHSCQLSAATDAHLTRVCPTVCGNKRDGAPELLSIYVFMYLYGTSQATRSAEGNRKAPAKRLR